MESLPEIDETQKPMETIPVEQIDHMNAKSQK